MGAGQALEKPATVNGLRLGLKEFSPVTIKFSKHLFIMHSGVSFNI